MSLNRENCRATKNKTKTVLILDWPSLRRVLSLKGVYGERHENNKTNSSSSTHDDLGRRLLFALVPVARIAAWKGHSRVHTSLYLRR